MTSGDPDLIAAIRREIEENGPISFARFMEHSLYDPRRGFYASGRARLGREGDFFTNVSVGPAFGQLVAQQMTQMWRALGAPRDFVIVEQGAHHGDFARDVLQSLARESPDFFATVSYRIVEPAPVLKERQNATLADYRAKVDWVPDIGELSAFDGVFFANELLDAFPVHCLSRRQDRAGEWRWFEKFVAVKDDGFVFIEELLKDAELIDYVSLWPMLERSFEAEISLGIRPWIREISSKIRKGFVLLVDYGFSTGDRFVPERSHGTLQVRQSHRLLETPFRGVGQADITSHVDWDWLIAQARECGMKLAGLVDQHHFLAGILADNDEFMHQASPKIRRQVQTLLHPEMLGRSFQALVLGRNVSEGMALSGLRFLSGDGSGE